MTMPVKGNYAVMASREPGRASPHVLDDFPTPPWATRALMTHILGPRFGHLGFHSVWEPAAGRGCMSQVLKEYFAEVFASDVHDYGVGYKVGSFVGTGADSMLSTPGRFDWVVTNPPFKLAQAFAERALAEARIGVALLMRTAFLEGLSRYELFQRDPYWFVCPFVERVPMVKGRWDPEASTATSYAWFVWGRPAMRGRRCELVHVPPGRRRSQTLADDVARFAGGAL